MQLRSGGMIEQQALAHVLGHRLPEQQEDAAQPDAAGAESRRQPVMRADAAEGQHRPFAIGQRVAEQELQLARLVATVPRAALVILLATLQSFGLPPEGVIVIFGVDELMDMGRTSVNVLGNCMATVVVARWEGEFDDKRARVFGTPEEMRLDLAAGEPAFAESAVKGD